MSSTTDNIKTGTNIAVLPEDLNVGKDILITPEMKTPKEVGAIVGLDCGTVRQVLKENGIYIRKSWEYPKNK